MAGGFASISTQQRHKERESAISLPSIANRALPSTFRCRGPRSAFVLSTPLGPTGPDGEADSFRVTNLRCVPCENEARTYESNFAINPTALDQSTQMLRTAALLPIENTW